MTQTVLDKTVVGLSNIDNTSDVNKPVSTAQATANTTTLNSAKAYADGLVVGLWDDRGNYDASVNTFPAAGGSGAAGAVLKGDIWTFSVAGTLGTVPVAIRQTVRALSDAPAQTAANWAIGLASTDIDDSITSTVTGRAPSQNAVYNALALKALAANPVFTGLSTLPAGWTAPGVLGSSAPGVVAAGTTQGTATTLTNDVSNVSSGTGGVIVPGAAGGKYLVLKNSTGVTISIYPAAGHTIDALAANAALSIPNGGFVELYGTDTTHWYSTTYAVVNGAMVVGNIPGNAANVTGTVAIANGGTGATSAGAALTALGAQAALGFTPYNSANATLNRVNTGAITYGSYGSISVTGSTGGYAGIVFNDMSGVLMDSSTLMGYYRSNSGWLWQCDNSGNFTAIGNLTAQSDERLKTNWRDIDEAETFLARWAGTKHGVFDRIDTKETQLGLSAQSAQRTLPWTVVQGESGILSLNYGAAAAYATIKLAQRAILQEQQITSLTELVQQLLDRVSALESK